MNQTIAFVELGIKPYFFFVLVQRWVGSLNKRSWKFRLVYLQKWGIPSLWFMEQGCSKLSWSRLHNTTFKLAHNSKFMGFLKYIKKFCVTQAQSLDSIISIILLRDELNPKAYIFMQNVNILWTKFGKRSFVLSWRKTSFIRNTAYF